MNIELARRAFKAFAHRDLSELRELCVPDIEMDWSRRLLDPVVVRGFDGLEAFLAEMEGLFEEIAFEEEEILEFDGTVLVVSRGRFRGRASGAEVTARAANVWTIRDGKLARFTFYQTKEDALQDLAGMGAQVSAGPSTPAA